MGFRPSSANCCSPPMAAISTFEVTMEGSMRATARLRPARPSAMVKVSKLSPVTCEMARSPERFSAARPDFSAASKICEPASAALLASSNIPAPSAATAPPATPIPMANSFEMPSVLVSVDRNFSSISPRARSNCCRIPSTPVMALEGSAPISNNKPSVESATAHLVISRRGMLPQPLPRFFISGGGQLLELPPRDLVGALEARARIPLPPHGQLAGRPGFRGIVPAAVPQPPVRRRHLLPRGGLVAQRRQHVEEQLRPRLQREQNPPHLHFIHPGLARIGRLEGVKHPLHRGVIFVSVRRHHANTFTAEITESA